MLQRVRVALTITICFHRFSLQVWKAISSKAGGALYHAQPLKSGGLSNWRDFINMHSLLENAYISTKHASKNKCDWPISRRFLVSWTFSVFILVNSPIDWLNREPSSLTRPLKNEWRPCAENTTHIKVISPYISMKRSPQTCISTWKYVGKVGK